MTDNIVLEILKDIQNRLGALERAVEGLRQDLRDMRTELDGQFQMMSAADRRVDALERIVQLQGKRITALEQAK